jgi:hypothetical protein
VEEYQLELLNHELSILALCSLVVTISREETVLLRNLGIDTFYLPYYPVQDIRERMERIREKRKDTKKEGFLLVGTANNPPTMRGMEEIIRRWPSLRSEEKLYVGGFGSEPLKELCVGKNVVFRGQMTDEELDELQAGIRGAVVYQSDGSGALTRICEYLLADVPVLANSHAARSYYNIPGIVEFKNVDGLAALVTKVSESEIECEPPLPPDASGLVSGLRKLCDEEGATQVAKIKTLTHERLSARKFGRTEIVPDTLAEKLLQYDNLKLELTALASERDSLLLERDALAASRDEINHSLSWRLTAPLRYVGKLFVERQKK